MKQSVLSPIARLGAILGAVCCIAMLLFPLAGFCEATGPSVEPNEPLHLVTPSPTNHHGARTDAPTDKRAWAVFGITSAVGVTTVLASTLALGISGNPHIADASVNRAMGLCLGIYPAIGVGFSYLITRSSRFYNSPIGAMMVGVYTGAILAYGGSFLYTRTDNPDADGRYDGDYFDDSQDGRRAFGAFIFHMVLPAVVPAIGAAIGYQLGRKRISNEQGISFSAPSPMVISYVGRDHKQATAPAMNLLDMTF